MSVTAKTQECATPAVVAESPLVSVIIPALNEQKVIGRCLESLVQLDFPADEFEVIVVDNGSKDATLEIVESFKPRLNLTVLQKTGVRISGLRNLGARRARGSILAFLDADCLAPQDWLSNTRDCFAKEHSGVIGAHYLLPENSSWVGRIWHKYQEAPKSGEVSHVPAGDLILRRDDFRRIGGFDESIQTNEDYQLCDQARRAGMPVQAFPKLGVVHLGTAQTLRVFYRKQRWHGTHVAKVFLRNVLHSHNLMAVLFAAYTLGCAVVILAGAAWAIFGGPWQLAPAGAVAMLLPPLSLALRRTMGDGSWHDLLPLAALYLTYGLARARALLKFADIF